MNEATTAQLFPDAPMHPGWQVAARLADVRADTILEVAFEQKAIILLQQGGTIAAWQGLCPHGWARLGGGQLKDGWLHCPRHMAKFRLDDGACGPGWSLPPLKRYATLISDGFVYVTDPLEALT